MSTAPTSSGREQQLERLLEIIREVSFAFSDTPIYKLASGHTSNFYFNMKKTTLESVVKTMEQRRNRVTVPEEVRMKAKLALDRMLAVV
jgi:quinolinate synthase